MPVQGQPLGFQMDPIPIPKDSTPEQMTAPPPQNPPARAGEGVQPYYGGKAGAAANIADSMLRGWMAGVHQGNLKKEKQAANEINSAKTGVDVIGQAYRSAVESGDEKKIAETKAALTEAWTDYINKSEKYAIPQGKDGKKQSTGSKVKEGLKSTFLGADPHLIAQSTIDILKKADPTSLYGPSAAEQKQAKLADYQMQDEEKQRANQARWDKITQEPDQSKLTPQDKKFQEWYEYQKFGRSPAEQKKDALLGKIMGGEKLSDQEREVGEQLGLVKPKVTSTQIGTFADKNGNPYQAIVAIGPDGKMVGQPQPIPGKMYVPPDQAQLAGRMINAQVGAMVSLAGKAHPEWTEQQKYQFALNSVAGPQASATIDWQQKQEQMEMTNRAIAKVLQKHTHTRDGQQSLDEAGHALQMFAPQDPSTGMYVWSPLNKEQSGILWWKSDKYAGMSPEEAQRAEAQARNELRVELKAENKKLSDADIEKILPPSQFGGSPQAMTAPPAGGKNAAGGLSAPGLQPPPGGPQKYNVTIPGQGTQTRTLTDEQKALLEQHGVKIIPYSTNQYAASP